MANFRFNGIDALAADLMQLAQLSDDDKWAILSPGAEVIKAAHQNKIRTLFVQHTGALADSITVVRKNKDGNVYAQITPKGKHPKTSPTEKTQATNAEAGYVLEHGSPRIAATHWMETANDEAEADMLAAEAEAWDQHLTSKGF